MTAIKKMYNKITENKIFYLNFIPVSAAVFFFGSLMLIYPGVSSNGIREGINICLNTVVPTIFPFMFLATAAFDIGVFDKHSEKAEKITAYVFRLPGVTLPIIAMSLVGGYPVGPMLIADAYEKGQITSAQGKRMMLFCFNPGPAFAISTVGYTMLSNKKIGLIIYASVMLSSLITGILTRLVKDDALFSTVNRAQKTEKPISLIFSRSADKSSKAILNICMWVVVFTCIGNLAEIICTNEKALLFFKMISEVTGGVIVSAENFPIPIVCGVISFGGLCVHLQIMPYLLKLKLKYKYFIAVRIFSSALSSVISLLIFNIYPENLQVISLGNKPESVLVESSFPVCVWLMLMCGLFIIGDNYILKRRKKHVAK